MTQRNNRKCALILLAEGFAEIEMLTMLCALRQAGMCVKCVGVRSGLIGGAQGVWLMPDLILEDVPRHFDIDAISLLILPAGERTVSKLESDPRVHRLLGQVLAHQGVIVTAELGVQVVRTAVLHNGDVSEELDARVLRYDDGAQSLDNFAQYLVRRFGPVNVPPR